MTQETFRFRLFIAGGTENAARAVANLAAICDTYLPDQHAIEVIDVFREPRRALADSVFMTPALVRLAPGPVLRIVGTLSDKATVLHALGLAAMA